MIEKTILDSGLVVVSDYIPAYPSFSLSYTLRGGSRTETPKNNGIHHLIEHMMFKGSQNYDLKQIADITDRLGGHLNAFTSKEITQFYIKAVDEKLDESFHLLTDIVLRSTFPKSEFQKEKNVAIQEIKESEDNPETNAFETFYEDIYKSNGLGYPIAGKIDGVSAFQWDMVCDYYKNNYTPDNFVLGAAGNIKHEKLVELANNAFKDSPTRSPRDFNFTKPDFHTNTFHKSNDSLQQVYVIIGFDSISAVSPQRHRFSIMSDILGGGMSSRLFQAIREEKGLAYTVATFSDSYLDCGVHLVYSVVDKDNINQYMQAVKDEIELLKKEGISQDELDRSRDHMKASVILGMENSLTRMRYHVANELNLKKDLPIEAIVEDVNAATVDDINQLIRSELDMKKGAVFLYGDVPG